MKATVERIVYPGRSMARVCGKVIFTDEGLPKEEISLKNLKEKGNYILAVTDTVEKTSAHRVKTRCKHYKICSPYQYIAYPHQIEIKKEQVRELFSHELKINLDDFDVRHADNIWGYRNKVHLRVIWKQDKPCIAYHTPDSLNKLSIIEQCFLMSDKMNKFLIQFLDLLLKLKLQSVKEIILKESYSSHKLFITIIADSFINLSTLSNKLRNFQNDLNLSGAVCIYNEGNLKRTTILCGDNYLSEKIMDKVFCLGPQSFFQVNIEMLLSLINDLKQHIPLNKNNVIADLYCGIGTFGIIFSEYAKKIYGIESDPENVLFLRKNIEVNDIKNFTVCEGTSESWVNEMSGKNVDILITDPPRKGLEKNVCKEILTTMPPLFCYISCNPATLTKDLKILLSKYHLRHVYMYDFFPHTPHIETLTILEKN